MTPREIVEVAGVAAATILAILGFRKAMRESVGSADENARKLRDDIRLLDRLVRALRHKLHQLEVWVIAHMWAEHDERFDPSSVYDPTDPEGDSGGTER